MDNAYSEAAIQRCSEDMQQIYKKTPMPKCNFHKEATLLKSHFA